MKDYHAFGCHFKAVFVRRWHTEHAFKLFVFDLVFRHVFFFQKSRHHLFLSRLSWFAVLSRINDWRYVIAGSDVLFVLPRFDGVAGVAFGRTRMKQFDSEINWLYIPHVRIVDKLDCGLNVS